MAADVALPLFGFGLAVFTAAWLAARAALRVLKRKPGKAAPILERIGLTAAAAVPGWADRFRPDWKTSIDEAGWSASPEKLLGGCLALAAAGGVAALAFAPALAPALIAACGAAPWGAVRLARERRRREVQRDLPFALDLVALSMSAGIDLEESFRRLSDRLPRGVLSGEFQRMLAERQMGLEWDAALEGVGRRLTLPAARAWVTTLLQARQAGMPLAPILRGQAQDLRALRLREAERQAHRAPVKMLFPLVFCILPVVFLVLLGPMLHRLLSR